MTDIKAIELINVNKAFTERRKRDNGWLSTAFSRDVLCNINLSIPTGSIFGLAGLNGVGKTTRKSFRYSPLADIFSTVFLLHWSEPSAIFLSLLSAAMPLQGCGFPDVRFCLFCFSRHL